jgi:hypothetical protein
MSPSIVKSEQYAKIVKEVLRGDRGYQPAVKSSYSMSSNFSPKQAVSFA